MLLALAFSTLVGVLSGLYPVDGAARLDQLEVPTCE